MQYPLYIIIIPIIIIVIIIIHIRKKKQKSLTEIDRRMMHTRLVMNW